MLDNCGDKIEVRVGSSNGGEGEGDVMHLTVSDRFRDSDAQAELTPAQARKLAKKLKRMAREIEASSS